MPPEEEKQAFLEAIEMDRYDEITRRVFADWLTENGFDDEAQYQREWTPRLQQAIDFIVKVAQDCEMSYEEFTGRIDKYLETGHLLGLPMNIPEEDPSWEKFWEEYHIVTKKDVTLVRDKKPYFCNCGPWMEPDDWYEMDEDFGHCSC